MSFQNFPYNLLGCGTLEEFFLFCYDKLILIYSFIGKFDMMDVISAKLNIPVTNLLEKCFPALISHALLILSNESKLELSERALEIKSLLEGKLSVKISTLFFSDHFDKIFFIMLEYLHDPEYLSKLCIFHGNLEDYKILADYSCEEILNVFNQFSTRGVVHVLENFAADSPHVIERILIYLRQNIEEVDLYEDKIYAFHKYIFFVEILTKGLIKNGRLETFNVFFIRDVVFTLIAMIRRDDHQTLTNMACKCIKIISKYCLSGLNATFGEFLPSITASLTPIAASSNKNALEALEYLVCENYSQLEGNIIFLDPFPSDEIFNSINKQMAKKQNHSKNLIDVIQNFIKGNSRENSDCRIEGLMYLRRNLVEKKDELKEIYDGLAGLRGFSEDCKNSLMHQLICILIKLTTSKNLTVRN